MRSQQQQQLRGLCSPYPHHPPTHPHIHTPPHRYRMVYGWTPFITMCSSQFSLGNNAAGALAPSAKFVLDPSPFWAPPEHNHSELGE